MSHVPNTEQFLKIFFLSAPLGRQSCTYLRVHFCAEVYNALSILQAVGYRAKLDSYRTISSQAEKLPTESQLGWGSFARKEVEEGRELTCQLFYDFTSSHLKDRQFGVPKTAVHPTKRLHAAMLETGDVVIVVDQRHPRGIWPKGIVEKTYPGADSVVRSV